MTSPVSARPPRAPRARRHVRPPRANHLLSAPAGHVRAALLLDRGTNQRRHRGEKLRRQSPREEHRHRGAGHLRF